MLTVHGARARHCDGINRRSFLRIDGLALGRLSLPGILRAQESSAGSAGGSSQHREPIAELL